MDSQMAPRCPPGFPRGPRAGPKRATRGPGKGPKLASKGPRERARGVLNWGRPPLNDDLRPLRA
eukprot:472195-Pyramimonas_sp.AAC.1